MGCVKSKVRRDYLEKQERSYIETEIVDDQKIGVISMHIVNTEQDKLIRTARPVDCCTQRNLDTLHTQITTVTGIQHSN